jgi:glycogen(starch) synthase
MRVSIVICTYNRAKGLEETLECLRHQNYNDFEVVVVNGPSTDDTEDVLERWADRVRVDRCPLTNLSVSRNIGIRAASGDIVAFIDDDALPDFDWLQQALPAFTADEVAGVGGIVFDHTGVALQYKYSAANRFAEVAVRHDRPFDDQCAPGTFQFPYLQGTNALFRRDALLLIGGFDETFDYYLDETDVCVRLIDAGYVLRQLDNAPVHHKFLPSGVRDHQRVITNWYPIMKNQVYFSYRHALGQFSEWDIHQHSQAFLLSRVDDAQFHENAGRLPINAANHARMKCAEAFRVGMQLGWERFGLRLGPVTWPAPGFKRFETVDLTNRRKLTLVTSGYVPNMTGGIARFFSDLAPALARRGHEVRVITKAIGPPAVDLEDGVWVHRIDASHAGEKGVAPAVFEHINDFATAVVGEIERIETWSSHDLVYGPMWDVEILGVIDRTGLPTVIQVATPVAIAANMAGHLDVDDADNVDDPMRRLMKLEQRVIEEGDLFHANSEAVAETIRSTYVEQLDPVRWEVVHLGLVDNQRPAQIENDGRLQVFFVGRFEMRKGIDTFLEAVSHVAPDFPHVDFIAAGEDRPLAPGQPKFGEQWLETHATAAWIEQVRIVGPVTDDELHRLYNESDLVVLPSRYESFGLVMVEAMIHGKALISCDTSGIRDVVRDGVDGVLVEPGNATAVEHAMRRLLDNQSARETLGAAARQRYLDSFHIDRFAERFDHFLGRITVIDPVVTILTAGESATFFLDPTSAARVVVAAVEPASVEIGGRSLHLQDRNVVRIPVDTAVGSVEIRCITGEVRLMGVIAVSPADTMVGS